MTQPRATCPGCGSSNLSPEKPYPGAAAGNPLKLETIVDCASCKLAFALPLPTQEQLDQYYSQGTYWREQVSLVAAMQIHGLAQGIARAAWCAGHNTDAIHVADVGAGYGWQAEGILRAFGAASGHYSFLEPDDQAAAAIERRSMPLERRRISELEAGSCYSLIFLNQVLEHVADPSAFLISAKAAVRPGGHIYIETPLRDDCFKSDVFPHTLFFSAGAMTSLIDRVGLELVAIEEFGRSPPQGIATLAQRGAFRLAVASGWQAGALFLDSNLWQYWPRSPGIWLRALARQPA